MQMPAATAIARLGDRAGVERRVLRQRPGRGRARNAPPDPMPDDPVVRLDQVAGARQQEHATCGPRRSASPRGGAGRGRCANPSPAPRPIARGCRGTVRASPRSARTARTSRRPSRQTPPGSCRCRAAGSSARRLLDDGVAQRHLAVAGQDRVVLVTNRENRGGVKHGWKAAEPGWTGGAPRLCAGRHGTRRRAARRRAKCARRQCPVRHGRGAGRRPVTLRSLSDGRKRCQEIGRLCSAGDSPSR